MQLIMTSSLGPGDVLLNGAALVFIVTLDDELPKFFIKGTDRDAILGTLLRDVKATAFQLCEEELYLRGWVRVATTGLTSIIYFALVIGESCEHMTRVSATYFHRSKRS